MGVDLKVMASHYRERRGEFLATATLRLDREPHSSRSSPWTLTPALCIRCRRA
jgi:hypothetical protein